MPKHRGRGRNYNGQIAKITCPRCRRPKTTVMSNYTVIPHAAADEAASVTCRGPECTNECYPCCPELVFEQMLSEAGLRDPQVYRESER